ncbi:MAG: PQQ-binding-like beta-propeller repeat protein, partial [Staphylothermus sp.]|nr:PQQ-binding-like beta-propeller repeat protein [Staphylothermus sp.]
PIPGLSYSRAFVYASGGKLYRTYVKRVSGVNHLFLNDMRITPIYGSLYGVLFNGLQHAMAVKLLDGSHAFVIIEGQKTLYRLMDIEKGFLSKKKCRIEYVDLGITEYNIVAVIHTGGALGSICRDYLIYQKEGSKFNKKEYNKLISSGWNGLWFSYIDLRDKDIILYFILWNGSTKKYKLPRNLIPKTHVIPNSIIHYDLDNEIIVLSNSIELIGFSLKDKKIIWSKKFSLPVRTPYIYTHDEALLVYTDNDVYIIDVTSGDTVWSTHATERITACTMSDKYLLVAHGDLLRLYTKESVGYKKTADYRIPGSINGVTVVGDDILIGYATPSGIPRVAYVSYSENIVFKLKDVEITSGGLAEIEVGEVVPNVRILKPTPNRLRIGLRKNRLVISDLGTKPGRYITKLLVEVAGFLPIITDLSITVAELESLFKKISMQSTIIHSEIGAFIPLSFELISPVDELYVTMSNVDGLIYATTNVLKNLKPGNHVVPLYVLWAKMGMYETIINISAWLRKKKYVEKLRTKFRVDYDILPLYLRVVGDTSYIWSPISIRAAKIVLRSKTSEYTIVQDLVPGWNTIETYKIVPDEAIVELPSGIAYIVRRGEELPRLVKTPG